MRARVYVLVYVCACVHVFVRVYVCVRARAHVRILRTSHSNMSNEPSDLAEY